MPTRSETDGMFRASSSALQDAGHTGDALVRRRGQPEAGGELRGRRAAGDRWRAGVGQRFGRRSDGDDGLAADRHGDGDDRVDVGAPVQMWFDSDQADDVTLARDIHCVAGRTR